MKNKIILGTLLMFIFIDIMIIWISLSISPVRLKREMFSFQFGEEIPLDVSYYIHAHETIIESVTLDLSQVKNEVGLYDVSASYYNEVIHFKVQIVDTIKPKVTLKNIEYKIQLNEEIVAEDLIESVNDYSSTYAYFYDETNNQKYEMKSYNEIGSYVEKIIVEDIYGNQSASLRVKIVVQDDQIPPVIKGIEDLIINQYDEIDLYQNVYVIDDIEGDITDRLVVRGDVENGVKGEYIITYSAKDSTGNECVRRRKVTVR